MDWKDIFLWIEKIADFDKIFDTSKLSNKSTLDLSLASAYLFRILSLGLRRERKGYQLYIINWMPEDQIVTGSKQRPLISNTRKKNLSSRSLDPCLPHRHWPGRLQWLCFLTSQNPHPPNWEQAAGDISEKQDWLRSDYFKLFRQPSCGGLEVERWSDNRTDSALVGSNPV